MAVYDPKFCEKTGQEHTIRNVDIFTRKCNDCKKRLKVAR